jgi:hypothetical protein
MVKEKGSHEGKGNGSQVQGKASMSGSMVPGMSGGPNELLVTVSETSVQSLFKSAWSIFIWPP